MTRKDIRPKDAATVCDVCGRTLLRGERADPYLHSGHRRLVCELCRGRAVNEGWIPEAESLGPRAQWGGQERRRSLLGRASGLARSARSRWQRTDAASVAGNGDEMRGDGEPSADGSPSPASAVTRHERHVHAVPTSVDMKHARAIELFNASEHPRSVAGIARSLGPPTVTVRADPARPSVVGVLVAWELSWYRYEVDLADEDNGVRVAAQGTELGELGDQEQSGNAEADVEGFLALAS